MASISSVTSSLTPHTNSTASSGLLVFCPVLRECTLFLYINVYAMSAINVTELRQHLPAYLKQVQQGEEIAVTLHGQVIARLVPDRQDSERDTARKRLEALRGTVIVGDIVALLSEEIWNGDADAL